MGIHSLFSFAAAGGESLLRQPRMPIPGAGWHWRNGLPGLLRQPLFQAGHFTSTNADSRQSKDNLQVARSMLSLLPGIIVTLAAQNTLPQPALRTPYKSNTPV
jgi:hypothetical protein